jgi:hypothetical protein
MFTKFMSSRLGARGVSTIALILVIIVGITGIAGAAVVLLNTSMATSTMSIPSTSSPCETASTSPIQSTSVIIPLLNAYSGLTWLFQGVVNGTVYNFTASYNVVSVNSMTYEVNIFEDTPSRSVSTTVWFLTDGTVEAIDVAGQNFSGSLAGYYFQTYFSTWESAIEYAQVIAGLASSSFFRTAGTSVLTLGSSEFAVTNYTASSLPETIPGCNGESVTLYSGGVMSVGEPTSSDYPLITYISAAGSAVITGVSGEQQSVVFNIESEITSAIVAPK